MIQKDDRRIAGTLLAGLWMLGLSVLFVIASVVYIYFFILAGLLFLVGLATVGYSVLKGLHTEKKGSKGVTPHQLPDCKIIAKFAINGIGEMIFNEQDILDDDPDVKFYVQLQPQNGAKIEFKTTYPVWATCGEGMTGTAMAQGDWLGAFAPRIGTGQGEPHAR